MNFCSHCGAPVSLKIPPGDNLPRHVCDQCGTIHYQKPKVVVGAIATWEDKILTCRRAIEPYGKWTLPAGFMENNETCGEFAQEQVGAISALWRMEMRGVDVGERWDPVVAKVQERWHEHILPFLDMHFVYALARGGRARESREFLVSMIRHGEKDVTGIWESIAIPMAESLIAYAERRYASAADLIGPVLPRLHLAGGSHAQRDVFVQTWIDASVRAGHHSAVADVLHTRARAKPKEAERLMQLVTMAA